MKKILICGDSFAADWTKKYSGIGWPNLLAKEYNVTNLAQAGCSQYKIYQQIVSVNLKKFDHIIISHTSPYRIYVKDHPLHKNDLLHKDSDLIYNDIKSHDELKPITEYFEKYFDLEYAKFTHNLICKEIDSITKDYPVIHITGFEWKNLYNFTNLIMFEKIFKNNRGLMNHYSNIGNEKVYKILKSHL